jgi:hypothetical protein
MSEETPGIRCPVCGEINFSWSTYCQECRTALPRPEDSPPPLPDRVSRPWFILLWIMVFGLYVLTTILSAVAGLASSSILSPLGLIGLLALALVLFFSIAVFVGVWKMEPWSRFPAMVLQVLLVVQLIYSLIAGAGPISGGDSEADHFVNSADVCGTGIWLLFNVLFIYWFATHQSAFRRRHA